MPQAERNLLALGFERRRGEGFEILCNPGEREIGLDFLAKGAVQVGKVGELGEQEFGTVLQIGCTGESGRQKFAAKV